jgi:hypothetical protein
MGKEETLQKQVSQYWIRASQKKFHFEAESQLNSQLQTWSAKERQLASYHSHYPEGGRGRECTCAAVNMYLS